MRNALLIAVLGITIAAGALLLTQTAVAQSTTSPHDTLIQKLVDRFGLNKEDVQKVFDEVHTERHAQMRAAYEKQLDQYVSEGKITEAQKDLILKKHNELIQQKMTDRQEIESMTPQERKALMESKKKELETWAQENNIDLQYLRFGKGHRMGRWGPR